MLSAFAASHAVPKISAGAPATTKLLSGAGSVVGSSVVGSTTVVGSSVVGASVVGSSVVGGSVGAS